MGGSIRLPAACCGVVGLKPPRGRVSNAPVMGEGWAGFAINGPLARSVRDAALLLDVMAKAAVGDPYCAPAPALRFADALKLRPRHLRLATIAESAPGAVDDEVSAAFARACECFRFMGHQLEPVRLDPAAMLAEVAQKLICAGISAIPVRDPDSVDPIVRAAWERGRKTSASEYIATVARMHNVSREVVRALLPYDALLTPTLPRPAMELGSLYGDPEKSLEDSFGWIPFTFPYNATGQPAPSHSPTVSPAPGCRLDCRSSDAPTTKLALSRSPPLSRRHAHGAGARRSWINWPRPASSAGKTVRGR